MRSLPAASTANEPPARSFVNPPVPLTAAAVGGLIGILLWFRPGTRAGERPGQVRAALTVFTALAVLIYSAVWLIEASRLPKWPQLGLHILMAVIAMVTARVCVQLALLH